MLRGAVEGFWRRTAALWALMFGVAAAKPVERPAISGRVRQQSAPHRAGARRLHAMKISPAHSSSVRKLQRAQRIAARIANQ